jgi:hypothetical protein
MNTLKVLKIAYGARKGKKISAQVLANAVQQHKTTCTVNYAYQTVSGYFNFGESPQGIDYWWKVVKAEALARKRLGLDYSTAANI